MRVFTNLLTVGLVAFASNAAVAQDNRRVVTVNYPLQYFAERLLGDAAEVVFPVPQDVDPSFWRPSVSDITMIQSADLILLNGAGFATWIDRVSLPRSKLVNTTSAIEDQFIITKSITHSHGDGGEHSHEGLASYVWLDPLLAIAQAEVVADAITARGLAPADDVAAGLSVLRADLEALDAEASTVLGDLQGVAVIATHSRYQYFARRYGLSISSLEWEAGAMPTDAEMANLQALVDKTQARVLIWEAEPPAEALAAATDLGLQNVVFAPLAHGVDGQSFTAAYADALIAMAQGGAQ